MLQIGLSILRETIGLEFDDLPDGASELPFPSRMDVATYKEKIDALYIEQHDVFVVESGEEHAQYELQFHALTVDIMDNVAPTKGKKNAGKKFIPALSKQAVFELLSEHRVQAAVDKAMQFVQTMEAAVRIGHFCSIVHHMVLVMLQRVLMMLSVSGTTYSPGRGCARPPGARDRGERAETHDTQTRLD